MNRTEVMVVIEIREPIARCIGKLQLTIRVPADPPAKTGDGGFDYWVIVGHQCLRECSITPIKNESDLIDIT